MEQLTNETVELLQTMIRNQCVNDGTAESGQEERNADTLVNFIEGAGLDVGVYDAAPAGGRWLPASKAATQLLRVSA